jgi:radical SAM protein with 4Fe4S-binding SPASM domain
VRAGLTFCFFLYDNNTWKILRGPEPSKGAIQIRPMEDTFYIQWHITNFCNLRCKHCYQDDFSKGRDLDGPGLRKISDNLLAAMENWGRTACIHLTGGEPLLKPELLPLIEDLDRDVRVEELGLITNGLALDPKITARLSSFPKLKKIKISLDGPEARINDPIRQEGVFERVIQTVRRLRREERFELIFMFTVMKSNFRHLSSYVHLCQELGMDGLILERFVPWGRGRQNIAEVMDREDWRDFLRNLYELFSLDLHNGPPLPYQAFQIQFHEGDMELSGAPCVIGTDGLCVMPEGQVFPCRRFPVAIGNLMNDSLDQLWTSSKLLDSLRHKGNLKGHCRTCEHPDCRGCRSLALALTGDYLEEDPHCCHIKEGGFSIPSFSTSAH